ncbi:hypothetical protein [Streptomyces sp. S3(2020)]|uniref:hypothetical protein n=1 Tax=Streptomyces sp. S3(2020) TaxID=2732044 RepID=UPI001F0F68DE|nr:hypothetical protein [Streptomyces sp. S3(2020)]
MVKRASAQSTFIHTSMLPGDHNSIIRANAMNDAVYAVLRARLISAHSADQEVGYASIAAPSMTSKTPNVAHTGDRARAESFLQALPPLAGWVRTLRVQDFFRVSGKTSRLFDAGLTSMTTNPIQYVDPDLRQAELACLHSGGKLMAAMIDLLFADPLDGEAEKFEHPEDAWVLKLGEYQPSVDESRLRGLRDDFFVTYDHFVNLLNERDLIDHDQQQVPKGRILQSAPQRKEAARLVARLEGSRGSRRLAISNTGTVDVRGVSVAIPPEASSFQLLENDLPIDVMRPGDNVKVLAVVVMGGGKSIFDVEITGTLEDGSDVRFYSKISI